MANKPFIHYVSPRLRRNAKQEIGDIVNKFNILMSMLMKACFQEAKELQKKLLDAQLEASEVQQKYELLRQDHETQVESSRQALARKQDELDKMLNMLQEVLSH